ncbi:MAG: dipeptidase [Oscillospiraceae bacterium]|jgi:membrane dipeptidase|nr:dipeptidase [Oscillospiraceae bacterium]
MILIDTHCDTLSVMAGLGGDINVPGQTITPSRMREGGVTMQVCTLFAGLEGPAGNPADLAQKQLAAIHCFTDEGIRHIKEYGEIEDGVPSVLLSVEGAEIFEGSLESLRKYYDAGVRMCALTWNHENQLGHPHCGDTEKPLKPFGWDAVHEMNSLGIAVDVSHLGTGGFWDLIEHAEKPPMASHSCCLALQPRWTRNLSDDQIKALIARGGWIGMNFCSAFLSDQRATIDDIVRHIAHIVELGGVKHVGFGSDFDGIPCNPIGLDGPHEFPSLLDALRERFSEAEVEGIAGLNFMEYTKRL